jgi:hypothetical protein
VRWFCEDRLTITDDGRVLLHGATAAAGALLSPPVQG